MPECDVCRSLNDSRLREGVFAQESVDGQTLFFVTLHGEIWKMPARGGPETQVKPGLRVQSRGCWRVMSDGIYYQPPAGPLEFFEFSTARSHRLTEPVGDETGCGFAVSPDRRAIVTARTSRSASEIMLVENFR